MITVPNMMTINSPPPAADCPVACSRDTTQPGELCVHDSVPVCLTLKTSLVRIAAPEDNDSHYTDIPVPETFLKQRYPVTLAAVSDIYSTLPSTLPNEDGLTVSDLLKVISVSLA